MSYKSDDQLRAAATIIRNETNVEENTAVRVGQFLIDLTDSKTNSESSGGVSSFSAGDLAPLFTTVVDTPTTTPSLTFTLSSAAQNTVFAGPATGGAGAPTYRALTESDMPFAFVKTVTGGPVDNTDPQNPDVKFTSLSQALQYDNAIDADRYISVNGAANFIIGAPSNPNALQFSGDGTVTLTLGGDNAFDMYRRSLVGQLERRTPSQVLADIAALPLAGGTLTGDLTLAGLPTNALHAATKSYVDNLVTGLTWKNEAWCATTADITLSGEQTIDGVTTFGSRVLVKNQSTASQNGLYLTGAGAWTRTTDADTGAELAGATVYVAAGTVNGNTQWSCSNATVTLGSTNVTFVQIAGAGTYTAGNGLILTGNVFSVPDATSTTKGIAKLYPSTSLGSNTDGAPDQNAVKTYVDTQISSVTIANASETVAGKVEEATDVETAAGADTGGTGAKLFVTPAKLATWWTAVKAAAQTFANLTATVLSAGSAKITGQAAASGKKNGLLILDDGTVQKVSWVEHDTTNRTITEQGVDDLVATVLREWKNSSGNSILKILNGQQIKVGGSTFVIEVDSAITSGNARVRMNDNQAMCMIFEDVNGKEHISFRSTDNDERFNVSIPQRFRPLIGTVTDANIDRTVLRFTSGNTNGATQTVGSVSLPSDETNAIVWVKWQAIANDGTAGWGKLMHGVQRIITSSTVQAVGTQDDGDGIQRTAGDFTMALAANNTTKAVDLNFTNNTTGAKVFKITAVIEYLIVDEPI